MNKNIQGDFRICISVPLIRNAVKGGGIVISETKDYNNEYNPQLNVIFNYKKRPDHQTATHNKLINVVFNGFKSEQVIPKKLQQHRKQKIQRHQSLICYEKYIK